MRAFPGCDIGKTRTENQDSIRAESFPDGVLALVCDGMGGMQNGSAASKIAVESAEERFCMEYNEGADAEAVCELLRSSVSDANRKVYQAALRGGLHARMGTTLTGVFARDDMLCTVNVGDSRVYRLPETGEMQQLTVDHTVVQLYYEQGMITAEERATHPRRNELMRAVGVASRVLADTHIWTLKPGERVLLCSDGLYNMMTEHRIAEVIRSLPPEQVPEALIAEANENGGKDNISVILLAE